MSLRIEPRRGVSWQMLYATPPLAVALTILTGFFLFLFMGYNPFKALMSFFVSPLLTFYGLSELGVKAAPLITIAVGPRHRLSRQCLEHRGRGPAHHGGARRRRHRARHLGPGGALDPARHAGRRHPGRHGLRRDPGLPQGPVRRQRDPDQPDAHLRRHPVPERHGLRPLEGPRRLRLPAVAHVQRVRDRADHPRGHAAAHRRPDRARGRRRRLGADGPRDHRLRDQGGGPGAGRRPLRRLRPQEDHLALPPAQRRPRRPCRHDRGLRARSARSSR